MKSSFIPQSLRRSEACRRACRVDGGEQADDEGDERGGEHVARVRVKGKRAQLIDICGQGDVFEACADEAGGEAERDA